MKRFSLMLMLFVTLAGSVAVEGCKNKKKTTDTTEQNKPENNVQVNDDQTLRSSVNDVVKNYSDVTAEVDNGVVTLKGSIQRDDLQNLIMKVQELKPKKVENKLVIK